MAETNSRYESGKVLPSVRAPFAMEAAAPTIHAEVSRKPSQPAGADPEVTERLQT